MPQYVQYEVVLVRRTQQQATSPTFLILDRIIEFENVSWSKELNNDGFGIVSTRPERLQPDIRAHMMFPDETPMEMWIYREGTLVYAGPLIGIQIQGENHTITLQSRGLLYYLRWMFLTSDMVNASIDKFTAVKNLVDHWQGQDYGNFGIDTSGIGSSGDTIAIDYKRTEIVNIAEAISNLSNPAGANGFDFQVDPVTRDLILYDPQRGTDKSTSVVIDERNMPAGGVYFDLSAGDYATTVVGAGTGFQNDGALWTQATNTTRRAQFGYAGLGAKWSDIENQTLLNSYSQALVDLHSNFAVGMSGEGGSREGGAANVFPVAGVSPPDIDPGDTIMWSPNFGFGQYQLTRDLSNINVSVNENGEESMTLQLV